MVNDKIHICVIDNGVFGEQVHLYRDMEVVGNELRLSVSKSDKLSHGSACANVIKKNIKNHMNWAVSLFWIRMVRAK